MAHTCVVCIACLAIVFYFASLLHAQENGEDTTKTILLSPKTEAYIHPSNVMSGSEQIDIATPAEASAGPAPVPEIAGSSEVMAPGDDNGTKAPQAPAPGKLFGSDDADQLFGTRGGFIHTSLLFQEEWTDNLYNTNQGQQSNLLTLISPGIWLGFPRIEEPPVSFILNNGAVGGHRLLVANDKSFERFQGYLSGTSEYKLYSANSELNDTAWRLEGFGRYNMPAGLSLYVLDSFSSDRDPFDRGSFSPHEFQSEQQNLPVTPSSLVIRNYTSNLVNTALGYTIDDQYTLNFEYTNFFLVYNNDDDAWLNRADNNFTLSLSYHFTPKTSFLIEYSYAVVSYEQNDANNSNNTFMYAGIDWKGSSKISLKAKGGYQAKKFNDIDGEDTGAFSMEAILDYLISEKTKISFSTYKAIEETNSFQNLGMDTTAARLRYEQRFSYRIQGYVELGYELNDYTNLARTGADFIPAEARRDTRYQVRPGLQYFFRDWLTCELSYAFEDRSSSDHFYDFSSQTFFIRLNTVF